MTRGLVIASLLVPMLAAAHPLGNFTINRWAGIEVGARTVVVDYAVDMAELPAFTELRRADRDGDGRLAEPERDAYLATVVAEIARGLALAIDGRAVPLAVDTRALEVGPGAGGMPTLRIDVRYTTPLAAGDGGLELHDTNWQGRAGWREVVARPGRGMHLDASSVPATDASRMLRSYPDDLLTAPLALSDARLRFASGGAPSGADAPARATPASGANRFGDRLTALVADGTRAWALVIAMLLGAMHALSPGHGKTVVGAYLVGSRGTTRDALLLGLVVTATHTIGVYALGLVALTASHWFVPERLFPWLSALSGAIVVAIGASLTRTRVHAAFARPHAHGHDHHHHHHGHTHAHVDDHLSPSDEPVSSRRLIALGVSGGLLPCPSALVVMLGAVALGRVAFGLLLIVAFSLGLAAVLTAIGIAMVHARRLLDALPIDGRVARLAPVASAVVISLAGLAILAEALGRIGA